MRVLLTGPGARVAEGGDIIHSAADRSLARSSLGYRVGVSFGDGIARTFASYRNRAGLRDT
jgi:nucleoside-diphosphate-sugar epimerase